MKRNIFLLVLFLFTAKIIDGQENIGSGLSLKQCVQMAIEKNINIKMAHIDKEKSEYTIVETRSELMPKINLTGSFQDNLTLPTTLIPGDFLGTPGKNIAMQMGSQYSTTASLTVSQVLFNRTALLALEISKKSRDIYELNVEKTNEEIAAEVSRLYFLILTTSEQERLIEENIARAVKLMNIAKVTADNGIGKQVDVDRVSVNLDNYYAQLTNIHTTYEQQVNMLKYLTGTSQGKNISLNGKADTLLFQGAPISLSDFSNHIDIKILESQKELGRLNQKSVKSMYLPSLSFSGALAYQGLQPDFHDYFNNNNKWYSYSYVGFGMSIPIFDGFGRHAKSHQARLEYQKAQEKLEDANENISMNYRNAMNNYINNKNNISREKQNLDLALKVYNETALRYHEGMATMSNLLQDEINLSNAQSGYLTSLYNFREAEVKIMSINGEIKNLFKK